MKINKITMLICAIITLISGIILVFINDTMLQGVVSGIFTGFIVSVVTAVIGYFYEREIILEKTDNNIRSLYVNLNVISKMLANILPQIYKSASLEKLPFACVAELSKLSIEFSDNMDFGLFVPIYKNGKIAQVYDELKELRQTLYNIKNTVADIQICVQDYTIKSLELENSKLKGIPLTPAAYEALNESKNAINVKTAKLHEYVAGKALDLDKIAKKFYDCRRNTPSWEELKKILMQEAENIPVR